jgi:methionyl-tRNA formyltransferase
VSAPRTVYLGTPEFAVPVLRFLADSPHRPALVVTQPDRPRGRGRRLTSPPVADTARDLGIELLQSSSLAEPEALERIRATGAELGVLCAFGQLIREPLLSELPMLNVHPSLLPTWRGAAPIERALMARDPVTGVTIMRLTEGLDSGPIALQEELTVEPGDDFGSLAARLAELAGPLTVRALELHASGTLDFREQDESEATYAEKIAPEDRRLDPELTAAELEARVRALHPHIGAYIALEGDERLRVERARVVGEKLDPGQLSTRGGELCLGTAEGSLRLDVIRPAGGKAMAADAYLRGHSPPARAL